MLEELAGLWVPVKAVGGIISPAPQKKEKIVSQKAAPVARTPEEVAAFVESLKKPG